MRAVRKRGMRFLRERRGVSGIISGVFLVGLTVMIFSALSWQFFRADQYNQAFLERQQREWERFNERLAILTVETGVERLNFTVRNYGSVTAHIVTLYFSFTNGTRFVCDLDTWISPGTTRRIANVGPKLTASDVYDFQVATARGNLIAPVQTIGNQPQPGAPQMVPFIFSFIRDDFVFKSNDYPVWTPAWVISKNEKNVYFGLNVTNTCDQAVVIVQKVASQWATKMDFLTTESGSVVAKLAATLVNVEVTIEAGKKSLLVFREGSGGVPSTAGSYFVYVPIFYYFGNDQFKKIYGSSVGVLGAIVTN